MGNKRDAVCQRSSNHKLKAIHNPTKERKSPRGGVSKIVKSQIESNSQHWRQNILLASRCVKDRQITNWKQFTTLPLFVLLSIPVCQRSSNHKLKAIHNASKGVMMNWCGVSKIVKSQIESNSQHGTLTLIDGKWCVKDRQITNWKQFTTPPIYLKDYAMVCQRSSNHKLKAIHNYSQAMSFQG